MKRLIVLVLMAFLATLGTASSAWADTGPAAAGVPGAGVPGWLWVVVAVVGVVAVVVAVQLWRGSRHPDDEA